MRILSIARAFAWTIPLVPLLACSGGDGGVDAPRAESDPGEKETHASTGAAHGIAGVHGTLLATVDVTEGHTVRFWELEPGVVAVQESAALDGHHASPLDGAAHDASLVDRYRLLVPGVADVDVPRPLVEADERAAAHDERERALLQRMLVPHADLPITSGDYYGDNYGAQWFLDRYCVEGGYRFCPTNWVAAYSGRRSTSWFKTCTMAADFDVGANFRGQHWVWLAPVWFWETGQWVTVEDWNYTVMPRHVECWSYSGVGTRESWGTGLQAAPRVHFSAMQNNY